MAPTWQDIASAKQQALLDTIPSEYRLSPSQLPPDTQLDVTTFPESSGLFTAEELEITSTDASELLTKIHSGQWTSLAVTKAFIHRACVAHQLTNCLSETLFSTAMSRAAELDNHLKSTGKPIGPLHGLPISLKDNFQLPGVASSLGFVTWADEPATSTSILPQILSILGAVHYVKTNVPTAMMIAETVNNLFGRTTNPRNRALTSGGSSGGESSLLTFHASPLGVGTDIGGSLRIPAACTGIYTLRPSFGRFPTGGARSGLAGQEAVNSVNGPMARSVASLELFASSVVGAEPWLLDPKCVPIPWRDVSAPQEMRIAVLECDGMVMPTPPVRRALRETVRKLQRAGHEILSWDPTLHKGLYQCLGTFFTADGGESLKAILRPTGEPFRPEMAAYGSAQALSVQEYWDVQAKRSALATDLLTQWRELGCDCLLLPTTPYSTVPNGEFRHVAYTGVFNIVDWSAVSFPTGMKVDKNVDKETETWEIMSEDDEYVRDHCEFIFALNNGEPLTQSDDADKVHDMPISLQLVAQRFEEEKVIEMMKRVIEVL